MFISSFEKIGKIFQPNFSFDISLNMSGHFELSKNLMRLVISVSQNVNSLDTLLTIEIHLGWQRIQLCGIFFESNFS